MPLKPGTRLGQYEIAAPIGAGGMGEVYRATDTKLRRDVAIKVLPDDFTQDPERLARFEREARTLASLNHTNVATLHGFETEGAIQFLVMELVDSRGVIEQIIRFRERSRSRVITLLGNHEQWMLRTFGDFSRHSWVLGMEALETICSYSEKAAEGLRDAIGRAGPRIVTETIRLPYELFFDVVPPSHLEFFEGLRSWYRSPEALCVHGGVRLDETPIEEHTEDSVVWGPDNFPEEYRGRELVVYGHRGDTPLDPSGRPVPRIRPNAIGLDSSRFGVLTAIRLPDRTVFQGGGSR